MLGGRGSAVDHRTRLAPAIAMAAPSTRRASSRSRSTNQASSIVNTLDSWFKSDATVALAHLKPPNQNSMAT